MSTIDEREQIKIDAVNKCLVDLIGIPPLTSFKNPTTTSDAEMNFALAKMYADPGYRKYLLGEIEKAMKNTALRSSTPFDIAFGKARILTLKEQLVKAKRAYLDLERLKAIAAQKELAKKNPQKKK